jgi:hypothetical protein
MIYQYFFLRGNLELTYIFRSVIDNLTQTVTDVHEMSTLHSSNYLWCLQLVLVGALVSIAFIVCLIHNRVDSLESVVPTVNSMKDQMKIKSNDLIMMRGEIQNLELKLVDLKERLTRKIDRANRNVESVWTEYYKAINFKPWQTMTPHMNYYKQIPLIRQKKHNILQTNFGVFNLSTKQGRDKWVAAVQKTATERKVEEEEEDDDEEVEETPSQPGTGTATKQSSSKSSAEIKIGPDIYRPTSQFFRKKPSMINSSGHRPMTTLIANTSEIPTRPRSSPQISTRKDPDAAKITAFKPAFDKRQPIGNLSPEEMKAKLEEGERMQYRRLFIPGWGWVSAKRLKEENKLPEKKWKTKTDENNQPIPMEAAP